MLPTISFIRVFIAMGTRRIFGTPHRAASTRAAAETIADATSPIPGSKPMIGSKPKRRLVPGTRRKSSIMIASHRKSGSREALVRRLCDRSSGGRISHSGSFNSRSLIFDATPHPSVFNRKSPLEMAENIGRQYLSAFQRSEGTFRENPSSRGRKDIWFYPFFDRPQAGGHRVQQRDLPGLWARSRRWTRPWREGRLRGQRRGSGCRRWGG